MSVYSFSQTQTFVQCPRKYQYKYVDKIKEKEFESSPDLILGHSVHAALERLYNQVNVFKVPTKDELLAKFKDQRDSELKEATIKKPLEMKWDQTLEDYIRRGIHYVANYYDKYSPFENITVVATEASITFDLNPCLPQTGSTASADTSSFKTKEANSWIKFRGFIDRLDKEEETFIINDYKTNKNLPPESKEEYQEQLTLYGLWVQQNYAKYFKNLKARLHYLHFDLMDERDITSERLTTVTKKYGAIIDAIEAKKFVYNMWDKKTFEPKENNFCKYCEYYSLCPLRAHLKFDDEVVGGELWEKTVKGLVDEYVTLSKQESQAKNDKELIKVLLVEYLEKNNLLKLFWNVYKISASQAESISIADKDALRKVLQELWVLNDVMEVDRFKLQKLVKERKLSLEQLGDAAVKTTSRTLRAGTNKE